MLTKSYSIILIKYFRIAEAKWFDFVTDNVIYLYANIAILKKNSYLGFIERSTIGLIMNPIVLVLIFIVLLEIFNSFLFY